VKEEEEIWGRTISCKMLFKNPVGFFGRRGINRRKPRKKNGMGLLKEFLSQEIT